MKNYLIIFALFGYLFMWIKVTSICYLFAFLCKYLVINYYFLFKTSSFHSWKMPFVKNTGQWNVIKLELNLLCLSYMTMLYNTRVCRLADSGQENDIYHRQHPRHHLRHNQRHHQRRQCRFYITVRTLIHPNHLSSKSTNDFGTALRLDTDVKCCGSQTTTTLNMYF